MRRTTFYAVLMILVMFAAIFSLSPARSLLTSFFVIRSSGQIAQSNDLALTVVGRNFVNVNNATVRLLGVNCGGLGDAVCGVWGGVFCNTYAQWQSNQAYVTAQLDAMKSWGCNCIRLNYVVENWLYNYENHRQMIKDLANLLGNRSMYMIYSGYSLRSYANGMIQEGIPYPPYQQWANASIIIPSKQAFIDLVVSEAVELKDYHNVLFGLWNEPHARTVALIPADRTEWVSAAQSTINAVRGNGSNAVILVQWGYGTWCNIQSPPPAPPAHYVGLDVGNADTFEWSYMYNLTGTNVAYESHSYDDFGQNVTYSQITLGYQRCWFEYMLNNLSRPILIGEIGANGWWSDPELQTNEYNTFNRTLTYFDSLGISYTAFEWRVGTTYALITSNYPSFTPSPAGNVLIARFAENS